MLLLSRTRCLQRRSFHHFIPKATSSSSLQERENSTNRDYSDLIKRYSWGNQKKLESYGVFEQNTVEELEGKLSLLETSLSLSEEETNKLFIVYPHLLNKEKRELEERIRHFREDWHCSDEQMKTIFTTRRIFQRLSLEDLKRMHSIYSNEWKIKKEKLPKALFSKDYWKKYKRQFSVQEEEEVQTYTKLKKDILVFSKDEFGKEPSDPSVPNRIIASKIFEKNSKEEIKEKLFYLSSNLLLSQEEAYRVMCFVPVVLNESFEELKKKVEFFKVKLGCSEKEWKKFFLSRGVLVTCPLWELELMYKLLSEEYGLQSKDIIRMFSSTAFSPSRLSEMIENIEERKYMFNIISKNSNHKTRSSLIAVPQILWMKPDAIQRKLNLFAEGIGSNSIEMIASVMSDTTILLSEEDIFNRCKQKLSLFMADLPQETKKSIDIFQGYPALVEAKAWPQKYDDAMKRLRSNENRRMSKEKEIQRNRIEARKRDEEVHKAFVVDKMMTKDKRKHSQQASELACALALAKSCDEIRNPYHRFLRETVEEGSKLDVLRGLGGYEEALEKMGKALRKGMVRESGMVMDAEEREGVGWLALKMFGAKEAEKLALNHEEALKVILRSVLSVYFTTLLSKLMIISSRLLLIGKELDLFSRSSTFACDLDAHFPEVMMVARAAERFIKDGGIEGGNNAIDAWKNGIVEEMSLEEGREYYRNHPVMRLVTELLLKTGQKFYLHSAVQMERIISEWEKTDDVNRKWDRLCENVNNPRLKDTEESNVFE